jgi:hypothetical protein
MVYLSAFILFVPLACRQQQADIAPFYDGMVLTYAQTIRATKESEDFLIMHKISYHFKLLEDGTFKVSNDIVTKRGKQTEEKGVDLQPPPVFIADSIVDRKGIVVKGNSKIFSTLFMDGFPSLLWLPHAKRSEGSVVVNDLWVVGKKRVWHNWEVWQVSFMGSELWDMYFDSNTGFLVGWESSKGKDTLMLVDTNNEELKRSIPKKTEE